MLRVIVSRHSRQGHENVTKLVENIHTGGRRLPSAAGDRSCEAGAGMVVSSGQYLPSSNTRVSVKEGVSFIVGISEGKSAP